MDSHEVYQHALRFIAKKHYQNGQALDLEALKELIVRLALAHPKILSDWIEDFYHYRDAELMDGVKLIAARVSEQPEYGLFKRRKKSNK